MCHRSHAGLMSPPLIALACSIHGAAQIFNCCQHSETAISYYRCITSHRVASYIGKGHGLTFGYKKTRTPQSSLCKCSIRQSTVDANAPNILVKDHRVRGSGESFKSTLINMSHATPSSSPRPSL
jgi:hypothetical protein